MNNKTNNSINDFGSVFPNAAAQVAWSDKALIQCISGQYDDQEWRIGEGYAVTAFELQGIPALVIVPWGSRDAAQEWVTGPILGLGLWMNEKPVVSYLPKHTGTSSVADAIRLFRNGKGFVGRLGNAALYEEYNRSAWGTRSEITRRLDG